MINRVQLLRLLPPYTAKKILKVQDQSVRDIMVQIFEAHKKFAPDYDKIAKLFWRGSASETAREVFNFLKSNVKYGAEEKESQSSRSPSAIVATGYHADGKNDCKHYSLFIAGVLDSLKRSGKSIEWCYRFANYNPGETQPGHVFVVLKENGRDVWVDPVLPTFNNRKQYINAVDKKVETMPLYQISGHEIGRSAKKTEKKAARKAKRAAKPKKRILLKIGAAPARNAFLGLVALNFKHFAENLYHKIQTDESAVKSKWEKLGGKYSKLKNTVLKAAKKKGLGAIGFALPAGIAAALPVINALKEFLGSAKEVIDQGKEIVESLHDKGTGEGEVTVSEEQVQPQQTIMQPQDAAPAVPTEPVSVGIQVRPAVLEGIPTSRMRIRVGMIGDTAVVDIKETPAPVKIPKYALPVAVLGVILATHKF